MRNLRLALRTLFKTPFVTVVAVASLALGIGANAAIYSLFNEMLLAPLRVPHPEQLVNFGGNTVSPGSHQCGLAGDCEWVFSYAMYRDLEKQPGPFSGVASHVLFYPNIAFRGQTVNGNAEFVSGSYFPVLEVRPALGRVFGVNDDKVIGGHPITVLSHRFWETQLGGDPSVVGRQIIVNGQSLTIVGVAQAGFDGTTLGSRPDLFVPITMRGALSSGWDRFKDRRQYWLYVFARLKPGVSMEAAQARENVLYHSIINTVEVPLQQGVSAQTLARFKAKTLALADGRRGLSSLHGRTKTPLTLLFVITLVVLAIACANIANLLLARAANRSLEMAVRLSLGATRGQLLRQLLTESLLLATLGGLAGLAVAYVTLELLVALLPADISSTLEFSVSGAAIGFAAVLSMVTGLLFGLFPALHSTRPDLVTTLRDSGGKTSSTRGAARFRTMLVTAQIALSMALLVSAGLFIESLANVSRVNLGIDVDDIVTFQVAPVLNGYTHARSAELFTQLEERLGALPGVRGVTAARVPLIAGNNWDNSMDVQGFAKTPDTDADAYYNAVGPAFFKTMGMALVSGREFTGADVVGAPRVAVVNESFAKKFGLGRGAVGKMIGEGDTLNVQIVGLVKDAHYSNVRQKLLPVYFLPYKQDTSVGALTFYVRSGMPSALLMPQIRRVVGSLDHNLPLTEFKSMPQQVRDDVYLDRMITTLSAAFAALATLLAAIGLYGVLAYSVAQRTKEIGVRMALGAGSANILRMVLAQVALMAIIGAAIGAAVAYGIGRGAASLLYEMQGHDSLVMIGAALLLACVALAAGYVPARRRRRRP
jgi:predicted permease